MTRCQCEQLLQFSLLLCYVLYVYMNECLGEKKSLNVCRMFGTWMDHGLSVYGSSTAACSA